MRRSVAGLLAALLAGLGSTLASGNACTQAYSYVMANCTGGDTWSVICRGQCYSTLQVAVGACTNETFNDTGHTGLIRDRAAEAIATCGSPCLSGYLSAPQGCIANFSMSSCDSQNCTQAMNRILGVCMNDTTPMLGEMIGGIVSSLQQMSFHCGDCYRTFFHVSQCGSAMCQSGTPCNEELLSLAEVCTDETIGTTSPFLIRNMVNNCAYPTGGGPRCVSIPAALAARHNARPCPQGTGTGTASTTMFMGLR